LELKIPFHIGFTGTREGLTVPQITQLAYVLKVIRDRGARVFHHGDCVGADKISHFIASELNYHIVVHPPNKDTHRAFCIGHTNYRPEGYIKRNHVIVDESYILVAAPKEKENVMRSGTWATIRYANKKNHWIVIVTPDGRVVQFNPDIGD